MLTLLDWPDYTSSSSESDVDQIITGSGDQPDTSVHSSHSGDHSSSVVPRHKKSPKPAIPTTEDLTAQKIMYLLSEIGTSNLVDRMPPDDRHFLHCDRCTGRLMVV